MTESQAQTGVAIAIEGPDQAIRGADGRRRSLAVGAARLDFRPDRRERRGQDDDDPDAAWPACSPAAGGSMCWGSTRPRHGLDVRRRVGYVPEDPGALRLDDRAAKSAGSRPGFTSIPKGRRAAISISTTS